MSGPFLAEGPRKHPAREETQVRAPSQEAARQTPVSQSPVKAAEQQALTPIPARIGTVDIEQFSRNLARLVEEGGRALAAYLKPREEGRKTDGTAEEVAEVVKTLGHVTGYWLADPQRAVELQARLGKAYLDLWAAAAKRLAGEETAPVVAPA